MKAKEANVVAKQIIKDKWNITKNFSEPEPLYSAEFRPKNPRSMGVAYDLITQVCLRVYRSALNKEDRLGSIYKDNPIESFFTRTAAYKAVVLAREAGVALNSVVDAMKRITSVMQKVAQEASRRTVRPQLDEVKEIILSKMWSKEVLADIYLLVSADAIYKSGLLAEDSYNRDRVREPKRKAEDSEEISDLLRMLPSSSFFIDKVKNAEIVAYYPVFDSGVIIGNKNTMAKSLIGGAEGDLIADNTLYEIKTGLSINSEAWAQLLVYSALNKLNAVGYDIRNISIYSARHTATRDMPLYTFREDMPQLEKVILDNALVVDKPVFENNLSLDESQLSVVNSIEDRVVVIAGPGSGKTTTLIKTIAEDILKNGGEGQIAFTYTIAAATHMKEKLLESGVDEEELAKVKIGTYHSILLELLRENNRDNRFIQNLVFKSPAEMQAILTDIAYDTLLQKKEEWDNFGIEPPKSFPSLQDKTNAVNEYLASFSRTGNHSVYDVLGIKNLYAALGKISIPLTNEAVSTNKIIQTSSGETYSFLGNQFIQEVYNKYMDKIKALEVIDYDDIIRLSNSSPAVIKKLRESTRIYVDEAQDFSSTFIDFIEKVAPKRILVIGDPRQTIYQFIGSKADGMYELADRLDASIYKLDNCYRYGRTIARAVQHSSLGQEDIDPSEKLGQSVRPEVIDSVDLISSNGYVGSNQARSKWFEDIAKNIEMLLEDTSESDIAILLRLNAEVNMMVDILNRRGIVANRRKKDVQIMEKPGAVRAIGVGHFRESGNYFGLSAIFHNTKYAPLILSMNATSNTSYKDNEKLIKDMEAVVLKTKDNGEISKYREEAYPKEWITEIVSVLNFISNAKTAQLTNPDSNKAPKEWSELFEPFDRMIYKEVASLIDASEDMNTIEGLKTLKILSGGDSVEPVGIQVITQHDAKGLEFPVVVVVDGQRRDFKKKKKEDEQADPYVEKQRELKLQAEKDEQLKLLLVAISRGMEKTIVYYPEKESERTTGMATFVRTVQSDREINKYNFNFFSQHEIDQKYLDVKKIDKKNKELRVGGSN